MWLPFHSWLEWPMRGYGSFCLSTLGWYHWDFSKIVLIYSSLPVSKMNISFTILFLPSPSLPPNTMRYCPNWVDEWQFLVLGGWPFICKKKHKIIFPYLDHLPAVILWLTGPSLRVLDPYTIIVRVRITSTATADATRHVSILILILLLGLLAWGQWSTRCGI